MIFNLDKIKETYNANNSKPWIFVLVGLPSSGKSTIADEISGLIKNTIVVSSDEIRQELFGDNYVRSIKTFETAKERIYKNILEGYNVAFDASNFNRYKREPIFNNELRDKYNIATVFLNEKVEDCLNRNHIRTRKQPVPDYEITNGIDKLVAPDESEGFDFRFTVVDSIAYIENDKNKENNYKLIDKKTLFEGRIFSVEGRDIIDENGNKIYREIVKHSNAACIIPILPDGRLIFVEEYRSAINGKSIAFPAGLIDGEELSITCAYRELEEETGYKAKDIEPIFEIHSSMGFTDEKVSVFIARNLTEGIQHFDEDEFLTLKIMSLDEALQLVFQNKITSAPTVAGLFYLMNNKEKERLV